MGHGQTVPTNPPVITLITTQIAITMYFVTSATGGSCHRPRLTWQYRQAEFCIVTAFSTFPRAATTTTELPGNASCGELYTLVTCRCFSNHGAVEWTHVVARFYCDRRHGPAEQTLVQWVTILDGSVSLDESHTLDVYLRRILGSLLYRF